MPFNKLNIFRSVRLRSTVAIRLSNSTLRRCVHECTVRHRSPEVADGERSVCVAVDYEYYSPTVRTGAVGVGLNGILDFR